DNARTPMQWNTDVNAGFSTGTPWLALNGNYQTINYEAQKDDPNSVLSYYKKLIKLRSESGTLLNGDFKLMEATRTFCAYCRTWKDECILVLLNFSPNTRFVGYGGATILSTYPQRKEYDGCLWPYEGVIVKGKKLKEKVK
ncbi:MAG: hypothetical protein PHO41_08075, partial [Eubacteriales bacterium]|nr:hypothetical protein [Eubacteriales bacterium]